MRILGMIVLLIFPLLSYSQIDNDLYYKINRIVAELEDNSCLVAEQSLDSLFEDVLNADYEKISIPKSVRISNAYLRLAQMLVQWDSPEMSLVFVQKALLFNPSNSSARLWKAKFFINNEDYDRSYRALVKVYPLISSEQYYKASSLADEICSVYDQRVGMYYAQGLIDKAFVYATRLDTLLMLYPQRNKNYNLLMDSIILKKQGQAISKLRHFSFLQNYDSIKFYFTDLTQLIANYVWYIDSTDIQRQKRLISDLMSDISHKALREGKINLLTDLVDEFSSLCDMLGDISCSGLIDSIQAEIYNVNFDKLLSQLSYLIENKRYNRAVELCSTLKQFVNRYDIDSAYVFYTMCDSLRIFVWREKLNTINELVNRHNFDSAQVIVSDVLADDFLDKMPKDTLLELDRYIEYQKVLTILDTNHLSMKQIIDVETLILENGFYTDSLIVNKLFQRLEHLSRYCFQVHQSFFQTVVEADLNIMKHNYLEADMLLRSILNKGQERCPVPIAPINEKLSQISPMVTYQLLSNEVERAYKLHDYERCFDAIIAMRQFYNDNNLSKKGIVSIDLYSMLTSYNDGVVAVAIRKLISMDSLDLAFRLLNYLDSNSVSLRFTKDLQKELGSSMAVRDYSLRPQEKPLHALRRYLIYGKWRYRYFLWSYFQQRSKMRSSIF